MAPSDDATALVHDWLDRLQSLDLEGLVAMYGPDARLEALREVWIGRAEIEDGFTGIRRLLRGIRIDDVVPAAFDGTTMTFETIIRGKLGRARVQHTWTVDGAGIAAHAMVLLKHDKHRPTTQPLAPLA